MRSHVLTMTVVLVAVLSTLSPLAAADEAKKPLTMDVVCGDSLSVSKPSQLLWTPDGRLSFFLDVEDDGEKDAEDGQDAENGDGEEDAEDGQDAEDGDGDGEGDGDEEPGRDLWVMDVTTGERTILVSDDELRSMAPSPGQAGVGERERLRRTRFQVGAYSWSPDSKRLLFSSSGQIWLFTLENREAELRAPDKKSVLDPKFSPEGKWISFVYEHDIWVVPVEGGKERQLTTGGHDLLLHGDLDWVYPEELDVSTGYHWSPDERHIAFLEMDESPVPTYPIPDLLGPTPTVDLQRYPRAGDPNPKVRVGIVNVESANVAWLDRHAEYIPRIDWADADTVAVQLLNRGQDELELVLADPSNGRSRSVFFERDEHWVDVTDDLTFIEDQERFLWTSARTGMRHVYLMHRDGRLLRQLTEGEYRVGGIAGLDEESGWLYYTANADNVLGSDLYRVNLDGSGRIRVTNGKGTHRINMNPATSAYIDSFSSLDFGELGGQTVIDLASGKAAELYQERDVAAEYELVQPELFELEADDGALVRIMMLKPTNLERRKKYPMVVYVYGMAGFPTIRDALTQSSRRHLFHQFLVQQGYVVAYVDDRSSSIPGHKYAILADHDIGPVAAADHRVAVEHFRSLPYVDGERMAVWGWSGGGFSTAFHMARTSLFKVGIAGAPVTDWRLYDSIYTERYMGRPQDDPEAYDRTSAVKGAADATGRLLLIYGTHDDNVHPQNTTQMVDALIEARKQFDVMMYPNKTHGIRGEDHVFHLYTMIFEFFERHLRSGR